jgi:hypothetical protein
LRSPCAIEEAVGEVSYTAQVVDSKRKELNVGSVEMGDDVHVGQIIATTTKLRLCFLIVSGNSGSRMKRDTLRNGERFGDNNINRKVRGGMSGGLVEVLGRKKHANISTTSGVVGDEITGFNSDTVLGGNEVGPGANAGADSVKGVAYMGTEGGLAGTLTAKEVITIEVKGGVTAGTRLVDEFRGKTRKA